MLKTTLLWTVPCAAILALCWLAGPIAVADEPTPVAQAEHVDGLEPAISLAQPLPEETLDAEVLRALEYWNPRQLEEDLRPYAQAIVAATNGVRADAIWLASQASVETKFIAEVRSFKCNRGGYRMCDHGEAVGPWQMHRRSMIGASPLMQAATALAWMKKNPQAWTTWRAARSQADAWLGAR